MNFALPCPDAALVELFATDNELEQLPAEMGQLTSLVKLQLSFNRLQSLPPEVICPTLSSQSSSLPCQLVNMLHLALTTAAKHQRTD